MHVTDKLKNLPAKAKKQLQTALLLLCAMATFAVPAFGGGYSVMKTEHVTGQAAAIEDVDLLLVAASAFGEARKAMNATDLDAQGYFVENTSKIVTESKWQNIGLIVGARDSLSGSTWTTYQSPITLSASEVLTYGNDNLANAYNKYKAFGFAVQNLNNSAQKSNTTAVSVEEGLDAMSSAAIKLGSFGVKFLNDYNPGPVLLALYDSRYLATYSSNKLVQIVLGNDVLKNIVTLFGDQIPGTGVSFFLILNAVIAIVCFALSMFLILLGNRTMGDSIKKFLVRIVIGCAGIYIIANLMSTVLGWVNGTIMNAGASETSAYVEENLNVYDWYLTGFQLPAGTTLQIDAQGNFIFTPGIVRAINEYTYNRLVGGANDDAIKSRMETYTQNGNLGMASFVTPSATSADGADAWATDVYYAIMKNYAENKEDLLDDGGDDSSPLHGLSGNIIYKSRYLWMSALNVQRNGDGWNVTGNGLTSYYGLNPISAFNLVRSDFSGESITATQTVYPSLAYVAFDVVNQYDTSASTNMNAITRFIACFTLVLAALKGLITIFTAGFAGLLSGGVKTAFGSSGGLGQAIGAVIALLFGIIGISVIMSMTLSLLDTVYGIAVELVGDVEVIDAFLQPIQDAVGGIPVIGALLVKLFRSLAEAIMTLILALTFPKLGGIPITMFAQCMADLPARVGERAQMIEGMLLSGRGSAGGGLGHNPRSGQYARQAQAMASQAFSRASQQAGAIMGMGAAAAASIGGAALSTVGKELNKKGDAIEGKPENPGVGNWDDMTPEQQAKAAEAAQNTEGWADMDEDARQAALNDAGVYDDGTADGGSSNGAGADVTEDAEGIGTVDETADGSTVEEDEAPVGDSYAAGTIDDPNAPDVHTPGQEDSMNQPAAGGSMPTTEGQSGSVPVTGTQGTSQAGMPATGTSNGIPVPGQKAGSSERSVSGASGGSSSGSSGGTTNTTTNSGGTTQVQNVKEGDHIEGGRQNLDTNVRQESKLNAHNVDASSNLNNEQITDFGAAGSTTAPSYDGVTPTGSLGSSVSSGQTSSTGVPGMGSAGTGVSGMGASSRNTMGGSLPTSTGSGGRNTSSAQQSGAAGNYTSVNQSMQTDGNMAENLNAQMQQTVQFNAGADQSRTMNQEYGSSQGAPGMPEGLDQASDRRAQRAADGGGVGQSMNQTSTSKWGKEMTIKEQRQARALHAAGDALQMMGGNRTMGQGISEALSYAKDAAIVYAMPDDLQNSGFITQVRMRRLEQQRRQDQRNNNKK